MPSGSVVEVHVHAPGDGEGDDERRAHEEVGLHALVDAGLEVAVPGEHRRRHHVVVADELLEPRVERAGVADAGGAAVAHHLEPERVEVRLQPGLARGSARRRASPGRATSSPSASRASPRATAFRARSPAASITLGFEVLVQEVMAAMTTSPCPSSTSASASGGRARAAAPASGVGRLLIISYSVRVLVFLRAPSGTESGVLEAAARRGARASPIARVRQRRPSSSGGLAVAGRVLARRRARGRSALSAGSSIRSCGRFGPATAGRIDAEVELDDLAVVHLARPRDPRGAPARR